MPSDLTGTIEGTTGTMEGTTGTIEGTTGIIEGTIGTIEGTTGTIEAPPLLCTVRGGGLLARSRINEGLLKQEGASTSPQQGKTGYEVYIYLLVQSPITGDHSK